MPDLHAPAGEQGHAPAQVGGLGALDPIQLRTLGAKLVVEMVDGRVVLLADVAVLRFDDFAEVGIVGDFVLLKILRQQNVRRGENFFAAQLADAGRVQLGFVALDFLRLAPAHGRLDEPATFVHIGTINGPRRREQPCPLLLRKLTKQRTVGDRLFENLGGGLQLLD